MDQNEGDRGLAPDASKAARLARFRGPVAVHDAETVEHWRTASPAAHAAAMIELAHYAEYMAALTGMGKDPSEVFPGFSTEPTSGLTDGGACR